MIFSFPSLLWSPFFISIAFQNIKWICAVASNCDIFQKIYQTIKILDDLYKFEIFNNFILTVIKLHQGELNSKRIIVFLESLFPSIRSNCFTSYVSNNSSLFFLGISSNRQNIDALCSYFWLLFNFGHLFQWIKNIRACCKARMLSKPSLQLWRANVIIKFIV